MHELTAEELTRHPASLLADVRRGEPALVTDDGKPVFLAVPMVDGADPRAIRVELAVRLFDAEQISLGGAAAIAGLSVSEIIDELGRRKIAVIRITPEELDEELKYVQTLVDRR
ncbi:MAG: UPF0175 family protein [Rhodocyclaceae bacterium]